MFLQELRQTREAIRRRPFPPIERRRRVRCERKQVPDERPEGVGVDEVRCGGEEGLGDGGVAPEPSFQAIGGEEGEALPVCVW